MRTNIASVAIAASLGLGSIFGAAEALALADVYPVKVSMKGSVQGTSLSGPVIIKESIDGTDLHNLVRGRALGTAIPTNEVLALAVDCANDLIAIIVYNTSNSAILAIVAELEAEKTVRGSSKAQSLVEMNMAFGGNENYALDNGDFLLTGSVSLLNPNSSPCFEALNIRGLGVIELVVAGNEVEILVTKASVKTSGGSIGNADLDNF